jgi:hypothetical protein
MTYEQFLSEVIEITEEDYIKVILSTLNGPKVFLERKPLEICVNPYMKVVLSAWKANQKVEAENQIDRLDVPFSYKSECLCTVKPVLRGHLWDKEKVAL